MTRPSTTATTAGLRVMRFGAAGARPKAYVQAAIHAEEIPALAVADHLARRLAELDARGAVTSEVILVPCANPRGLDQFVHGTHLGRFDLASGVNFNRRFPDLIDRLGDALEGRLGADAAANVARIRETVVALLDAAVPRSAGALHRHTLFRQSVDADLVLDLHCDYEALPHVYVGTPLWPAARDLSLRLGAGVTLLADDSGGDSFDEANSRPWWVLAKRFPQAAIPPACFAATVEFRGERDVDDALAARDAQGLLEFLADRGVLRLDRAALPTDMPYAVPLEGVDSIDAPHDGVVLYRIALGDHAEVGTPIADLLDPRSGLRTSLVARTQGLLFARRGHRYVQAGQWIAKVAGAEPLPWRQAGALLAD